MTNYALNFNDSTTKSRPIDSAAPFTSWVCDFTSVTKLEIHLTIEISDRVFEARIIEWLGDFSWNESNIRRKGGNGTLDVCARRKCAPR